MEPQTGKFPIKVTSLLPGHEKTKPLPEIIEAAKLANAHNFITSFRGGYDTLAGSLGTQVT